MDGNAGSDFTTLLPIEVVEEIFQNLSSKDLLSCTLVCVKWREIVNNNRIWAKICQRDGYYEKEHLRTSQSLLPNPTKKFRPVQNVSEKFSDICYWRSHYDKYKFLERNWRKGHCALHQFDVSSHPYPSDFIDGVMVVQFEKYFNVYIIDGKIEKFCRINLKFPDSIVHTMLVSRDLLIYSQERKIIGLKREEKEFVEDFQIDVKFESNAPLDIQIISTEEELIVKRAENYIIIADVLRPSTLFILNTQTGELEREIEFEEKSRSDHCLKCYCLEVLSLKLYVAFSINTTHYVREYDIIKNEWGAKFIVPFKVTSLYVTQDTLCAKVENRVDEIFFDLYVWSLIDRTEVANIPVLYNNPVILTNEVILYCTNNTVNIHSLQTTFQSKFHVPADTIVNMFSIGNHLLVINTGVAIEIWDWGFGEKLYTPYRGICNNCMWVNEKTIIVNRWSSNFHVIAYW